MASAPVCSCLLALACLLLATQAAVIDGKDGAGFRNFDGVDTPDLSRILSKSVIKGGHLDSGDNSDVPLDELAAAWLDVLDILEREVTDSGQRSAIQEAVERFSFVLVDEVISTSALCQEEDVTPHRRLARSLEVRNHDAAAAEVDDDDFPASSNSTSTEDGGVISELDETGEPEDSWKMKWKKMKAERKALRKAARKAGKGERKIGKAEKRARKAERKAARKAERTAHKKAGRKADRKAERKEARKAGKLEKKKQKAAWKAERKEARKIGRKKQKAERKAERKAARKAGRKADRKSARKAARKAERKAQKKAAWKKQWQEWLARRQGSGEVEGESEATLAPDEFGNSGDDSTDVTVLVPVIAST